MSPSEVRTERWSRESSAVLRACERPNVGDVYSPWGEVTLVTEGRETASPEARAKDVVEGAFCCSESVRATKRQRRIFSLWRCHVSDRGERKPGGPKLARKKPWSSTAFFVRAKGLEPIRTKAPDPKSGLATNYNTLAKPFGRLITLSPSLKSAFWKLPTSVSERITKLCIFFKNPKQPASGHPQKQSLT